MNALERDTARRRGETALSLAEDTQGKAKVRKIWERNQALFKQALKDIQSISASLEPMASEHKSPLKDALSKAEAVAKLWEKSMQTSLKEL